MSAEDAMSATTLAVDAGRTSCRVAVYEGLDRQGVTTVPATGTLMDRDGPTLVAAAIAEGVAQLGVAQAHGARIAIGVAGMWGADTRVNEFADAVKAALGVDEVAVTTDIITAHVGAHGLQPGVTLVAGTGAVAVGLDRDGRAHRVDGWGHVLGDAGSGHWLGREGLRAAFSALDGRGPQTVLQERAQGRFGPLPSLPYWIADQRDPARAVASFAADVLEVAEFNDPVAVELVTRAAAALATTVRTVAQRMTGTSPVPVCTLGGLVGPPLQTYLNQEL